MSHSSAIANVVSTYRDASGRLYAEYQISATKRRSVWIRDDDVRASGVLRALQEEASSNRQITCIDAALLELWCEREATLKGDSAKDLSQLIEVRIAVEPAAPVAMVSLLTRAGL